MMKNSLISPQLTFRQPAPTAPPCVWNVPVHAGARIQRAVMVWSSSFFAVAIEGGCRVTLLTM